MRKWTDIWTKSKTAILAILPLLLLAACTSDSHPLDSNQASAAETAAKAAACWQKDVFSTIYDIIGHTVMKMYNSLSNGAIELMGIALAVWIAFRLLKFVSSVTEDSPAEIWNEILKKSFVCLLCGLLASSSTMLLYTLNTLLFPIYEAFLEFGSTILAKSTDTVTSVKILGTTIDAGSYSLTCKMGGDTKATLEGFPPAFQEMMGCMVCAAAQRLTLGREIAWIAMSAGGLTAFFVGLLVWAIFLVVGFGFVFYLVDSIFRFGMMVLLLPLLILSYAFGPTRGWTKLGFQNIMNSAAFMMAFSIIIATTLMAMMALINDNTEIFSPSDDPYTASYQLQDFGIVMMCMVLIGFLVFGSMGISQQLTGAIIGGRTSDNFQKKAKAALQFVVGLITAGIGAMFGKVTFVKKLAAKKGAVSNKMKHLAGRD